MWNPWIPKKFVIFGWRAIRGRLPVRKTLSEMGMDMHEMVCPVCRNSEESINHLFLNCPWAEKCWKLISEWLKTQIQTASSIEDLFVWVDMDRGKEMRRRVLEVIICSVLNTIWSHRNKVVFEKQELSPEIATLKIKEDVFSWIDSRARKIQLDMSLWATSPFDACKM